MIIPSIDLMNRQTVQLIGGRDHALDAGDPLPIAERFGRVGEIAVIDLDAALSKGSNADLITPLLSIADCRVGGGIRDEATARKWLDAGASKIILGTAATPDLLRRLPRNRLIAALDASHGEVVVEGWQKPTGRTIIDRIAELRDYVGGFLVTFVEREGRMGGTDMDLAAQVIAAADDAKVTIAGGVTTPEELAALDRLGADAQVGMALYTGRLHLADAFAAPLITDRPDGLWPTVVTDDHGVALGLAYSNLESIRASLDSGRAVYFSRSRSALWHKGATSGDEQLLLRVDTDCDRDTLRFTVKQLGRGFCHTGTRTCFGPARGLTALAERIASSTLPDADPASYTARLLADTALLRAKLIEEAGELADAVGPGHAAQEAADLLYFTHVAMQRANVSLAQVEHILDLRSRKLTRRPGNAKPTQPPN